jgi:hypothetical protein
LEEKRKKNDKEGSKQRFGEGEYEGAYGFISNNVEIGISH